MKKVLDKNFWFKYKEVKTERFEIFSIFLVFSLLLTLTAIPYDVLFVFKGLRVGEKIGKNITAQRDYYAIDMEAFEKRKARVLRGAPLVIDLDSESLNKELEKLSEGFEKLRKWSQSFDYTRFAVNPEKSAEGYEIFSKLLDIKGNVFDAFLTFWAAGFSPSVKSEIEEMVISVLEKGYIGTGVERDRKIVKRTIPEYTEIYTDETAFINGKDELKIFVSALVDKKGSDFLKKNTKSIVNFIANFVEPNCKVNVAETDKRQHEILSRIAPNYIVIKKGEIVARKGEILQQTVADKLRIIKEEELKKISPLRLVTLFIVFVSLSWIFYMVASASVKKFANDKKSITLIVMTILFSLIFVRLFMLTGTYISFDYNFYPLIMVFFFPYALSGMILRLFFNTETAIISVFFMTILMGINFPEHYYLLIFVFSSAFLGLHFISYLYTRGDLIKSGGKTGLANAVIMLIILALVTDKETISMSDRIFLVTGVFFSGFLSSVLLIVLTPFIEYVFKYTTNITLFELSNLDNPLLKELLLKAPGTYNHSILIGTLAEAAARAIKVNPLLARVSAYYHDIGKIKKPEFFIENQMEGYNKHEELTPYMSVLVVLSHVKDGIELAKQHKLGQPIIDAIAQHHGTRLVTYFYAKALKLDPSAKEENFRYLGPKPKTREVALIMMADAVEAACRVLDDPSPSRIKNLVKKIIQDIFLDGQLDECELTLKDLNLVVESFTRTLLGIYHHRVDYPEIKSGKENVNNKKPL